MNGRQQYVVYEILKRVRLCSTKVVLLDNFGGMNLKEIESSLHSSHPTLEVVFMTVSRVDGVLSMKSLKGVFHLATASVVVTNNHIDMPLNFRSETRIVQVWHGTFPIKKIGQKMLGSYKQALVREPELTESLISSSANSRSVFADSFGIEDGQVLPLGNPSLDCLFQSEVSSCSRDMRRSFGIPDYKKTILYAPTFRENHLASKMLEAFNLDLICSMLPGDVILLLRFHRNSRTLLPRELPQKVIDLSAHPVSSEVLMASDALISDYSGLIFEYSILERPIFLFPYDLEEY